MSADGNQFLQPIPLLWRGETVFILAGGPSLACFDCERLRGCRVMAINVAYKRVPWADALFFTDNSFFEKHREDIEAWPGRVFTASRQAKQTNQALARPLVELRPDFPVGGMSIKYGASSGHTAIGLAIGLGAARVVLLGYDMRIADGRSHFHDEYTARTPDVYKEFIAQFAGWNAAAQAAGVTVVNATPGSALKEFPETDIDEEIENAQQHFKCHDGSDKHDSDDAHTAQA